MAAEMCPECGADWHDGNTCADHFHTMLGWELDLSLLDVHHLTVLCYHLQHPSLYSPEGLRGARVLLIDFVARGLSPAEVRRRDGARMQSGRRDYRIKGTPERHGVYDPPVRWTMTARDVVAAGPDAYYASVRAWAKSVHAVLRDVDQAI